MSGSVSAVASAGEMRGMWPHLSSCCLLHFTDWKKKISWNSVEQEPKSSCCLKASAWLKVVWEKCRFPTSSRGRRWRRKRFFLPKYVWYHIIFTFLALKIEFIKKSIHDDGAGALSFIQYFSFGKNKIHPRCNNDNFASMIEMFWKSKLKHDPCVASQ